MNTSQTTLTDGDPSTDPRDDTTERESSSSAEQAHLAPPDQRGGEGCCPWCLASADTFEHHDDGTVGCGYCDAAIPVGVDWFERGEKTVV